MRNGLNRTWTIGGWRLYVVETSDPAKRWHWNLREVTWGWEINGYQGEREDAIIEALDTAQNIDGKSTEAFREYQMSVVGVPVIVSVAPSTSVQTVLVEALKQTSNSSLAPIERWEVRTEDGYLCEHDMPIQLFFSHNTLPLNVSLRAGEGA